MDSVVSQRCTYVNAACVRASIRAAGMVAENTRLVHEMRAIRYIEEDFLKVIEEEGIGYNDVHSILFDK